MDDGTEKGKGMSKFFTVNRRRRWISNQFRREIYVPSLSLEMRKGAARRARRFASVLDGPAWTAEPLMRAPGVSKSDFRASSWRHLIHVVIGSLLLTLTSFRLNTCGGCGCKTSMVLTVALVPILYRCVREDRVEIENKLEGRRELGTGDGGS